ncbi:MAG: ParA family protein [Myxococcota bacterium]|jgi:chromosome partitioning protein|nr:ParA family protein [Myxococcota bacterium]
MSSVLGSSIRRLVGGGPRGHQGDRQAQVVTVCARKGGVGKTTTAVSLAAGAALYHDAKVLLIDMDGQGHCASSLHGRLRGVAVDSLSGVLLGKRRDVQEIALSTDIPGLWITPSDKSLGAAESQMAGRIGKEFLLRSALRRARSSYDLIVIDCPPNLGSLTVNALMAADWCLIPCNMSVLALEGVDDIFEALDTLDDTMGHEVSVLGILRTRVDARNTKVNDAVVGSLRSRYGRALLATQIPINTKLTQAQLEGEPIYTYDEACSGSRAYRELLDEVGSRLGFRRGPHASLGV